MARWTSKLCVALVIGGMLGGCGAPLEGEDTSASGEETGELAGSCSPGVGSTERLKSFGDQPGSVSRLDNFVNVRGKLYFIVRFVGDDAALWRSDGTSAGTVEVKRLPTLDALKATSSRLFFKLTDAAHGEEVWTSDGTPAGTHLLKDLAPGPESASLGSLSVLGERLVFFRGVTDPKTSARSSELWTSDGTASGTVRVMNGLPEGAFEISVVKSKSGDVLLFQTRNAHGTALWKTDGTKAGTAHLKDVDGEPADRALTSGGRVFFTVFSVGKEEVWTSDGTKAGTLRLHTYASPPSPVMLGVLGSSLYVAHTSGVGHSLAVNRIPVTGGAETLVTRIPNAYANQGALIGVSGVSSVEGGKKLYFSVTIDNDEGMDPLDSQLWVTDGTGAGTRLLHRPLGLSFSEISSVYAVADDLVFFNADEEDTTGFEPWVTNGTPGGSHLLKDLVPGPPDSDPGNFFRLGSRVFFSAFADDGRFGQLWSTHLRTTCSVLDSPQSDSMER